MEIRSKAEFFRLWRAGVLGNRTNLWPTVEQALASDHNGLFGFRELHKSGGGGWWEQATRTTLRVVAHKWDRAGKSYLIDDSVPNERTKLQGEVTRLAPDSGRYPGLYSYLAVNVEGEGLPPMRKTVAAGMHRHYGPTETHLLLTQYLDPASFDDLEALLELYPGATIELAAFACDVGVIPGRNTIFWETRNY